jgi:hypothetical protein
VRTRSPPTSQVLNFHCACPARLPSLNRQDSVRQGHQPRRELGAAACQARRNVGSVEFTTVPTTPVACGGDIEFRRW